MILDMCLLNLAFVFITIILQSVCGETELEYGDKCDDDTESKCSSAMSLFCNGQFCDCDGWTIYSKEHESCVPKLGRSCALLGIESKQSLCQDNASCTKDQTYIGNYMAEDIIEELVERGKSRVTYSCKCSEGFAATDGSNCTAVLGYGDKCGTRQILTPCNTVIGLGCRNHICSCNDTQNTIFDHNLNVCAKRLGVNCSTQFAIDTCITYAACPFPIAALTSDFGWEIVDKEFHRCQCLPGFAPTSDGKCLRSHNAKCSKSKPCNSGQFLECVNGYCRCSQGANSAFYPIKPGRSSDFYPGPISKCKLQPHSACSKNSIANGTSPQCIAGWECKNKTCQLRNSVYLNNNLENCSAGKNETSKQCNPYKGLACIKQEKCGCFDSSLRWNKELSKCTAMENGKCGQFNYGENNRGTVNGNMAQRIDENQLPSPDEMFFIDCNPGFSCIFQADESCSRCKEIKSQVSEI